MSITDELRKWVRHIEKLERKPSRKSMETSGESLKIADESIKIGDGE